MLKKCYICTYFITFFSIVSSSTQYLIQEKQINKTKTILPNFFTNILKEYEVDKSGIKILNFNTKNDDAFDSLLSVIKTATTNGIYIFNSFIGEIIDQNSPLHIITLNKYDISSIYDPLQQRKIISSRSTIILFFTDEPDEIFLMETLEHLWKQEYYDVFATTFSKPDFYLLTFNGYKNSYEKIKSTDYSKRKLIEKTRDLNGHPINVLFTFNDHTKIRKVKEYEDKTEKYEGKDYDMLKTIFEQLNADLRVIDIDDTIPDPVDNPWFSNLEIDNKSEIQRNILKKWNITMLAKSQRVLDNDGIVEVTYPHTDNAVTLLLPKRRKITKPEEFYKYVTQPIWYIHLAVLIVLSIFVTIHRKYYGIIHIFHTAKQLFRIMFTCSSYAFMGKNLEELLLLAWIIWCFLASIIAQAKITSMLSTDLYENELDSLEDIYRREELEGNLDFIIFGLNSYIDELAEKYEGSKYMKIIQDMVKVPMDENLGEIMLLEMPKATTFKMAIVLEHDIAKFYARHTKNRQDGWGRPYLHMMKHNLMPCFQVYHVTAGSPLLPIIDTKIRQLTEGGFIDYFKKKYLLRGLIDGYLYPDEDTDIDEYQPEPLNMDLAKYAFFMLFIGLIISTMSFILEISVFNVQKLFRCFKVNFLK